ncbi:MAG: hypothetical protein ACK56I_07645, partial [bacterium]
MVRVFVCLMPSLGGDDCHGDGVVDRYPGIAGNGVRCLITMAERRAPLVASSALEMVMSAAPSVGGAVELVACMNAGDGCFVHAKHHHHNA